MAIAPLAPFLLNVVASLSLCIVAPLVFILNVIAPLPSVVIALDVVAPSSPSMVVALGFSIMASPLPSMGITLDIMVPRAVITPPLGIVAPHLPSMVNTPPPLGIVAPSLFNVILTPFSVAALHLRISPRSIKSLCLVVLSNVAPPLFNVIHLLASILEINSTQSSLH